MTESRRIASSDPPAGGADRSVGGGLQLAARARELARALLAGFKQHDLLTYSSAIAFQILTAIIPFALFVLAVVGLLQLNSVWRDHLEPQLEANLSAAMFAVISKRGQQGLRRQPMAVGHRRRRARAVAGVRGGARGDDRARSNLRSTG